MIRDEKQLAPYRSETIEQTNSTAAYNHGRLAEILDPEIVRFVKGVRYSAILDSKTTDVCRYLGKMNDGKGALFKPTDPNLKALLPPNHQGCRSIIVAIVAGEKVDKSEFITPEQVGKARRLADARFLTQTSEVWRAYRECGDDEQPKTCVAEERAVGIERDRKAAKEAAAQERPQQVEALRAISKCPEEVYVEVAAPAPTRPARGKRTSGKKGLRSA